MKERSPKSAVFLMLIILVAAGAVTAAAFLLRTDSVEERATKGQLVNVLFTVHDGGRVRLIEVLLLDPGTKKGAILFLPEHTWLMLESLKRYDKLETLYTPGNPELVRAKIEKMIASPVPYWIDFDAAGLAGLVDLLGGIEVFIPSPVSRTAGGRKFLFESGGVVLDGDKAGDYLSLDFENESDMDRAQRRQDFLKALLERLGKSEGSGFLAKPGVFAAMQRSLHTNLSAQELRTFLAKVQELGFEGILYRRVHGTKRVQQNEEIFLPNDQGDQVKKAMQQAVEFLKHSGQMRPEDLIVKLEVLNGTETPFRARDCARIYKKYGYEVLREDNAPEKPVKKTVIVDHRGNAKMAQEVAGVIKCRNIETSTEDKTAADVTIILGMDFDGQYCQ